VRQAAVQDAPAAPQRKSGSGQASRWLRRQMWRRRAALGPVYAGCGLWVGAGMGHLVAPSSWWLSVPLGAAVTVAAAGPPESWHEHLPDWALHVHGWLRSEYERRYAGAVGAAGTVWLALDWWRGPAEPLVVVLAFGTAGIGTARLWHRRIRHDSQARRLRGLWRDHLAERAKLPDSVIQSVRPIPDGRAIRLRLAPGQTVDDVRRSLDRVISALSLRPRSCRVVPDDRHPRRCTILVTEVVTEPRWLHHGSDVRRIDPERVYVEPVGAPDAIDASPIGDSGWRPQLVEPVREPVIVAPLLRLPSPPPSDQLLDALRAAPGSGLSVAEIVDRGITSRATAFRRIRKMVKDGTVADMGHGRYRAVAEMAEEAW
jgi:hypothetical protein